MTEERNPEQNDRPTPGEQEGLPRERRDAKGGLTFVYFLTSPLSGEVFHVASSPKPKTQLSKQLHHAKTGTPGPLYDCLRQLQALGLKPVLIHVVQLHPSDAPAKVEHLRRVLQVATRSRVQGHVIATPRMARRHAESSPFTPLSPCPKPHVDPFMNRVMRDLRQYGPRPATHGNS